MNNCRFQLVRRLFEAAETLLRLLRIPSFEFVPPDLTEVERKVSTHGQGADDRDEETRTELDRHRVP